MQFVAQCLTAVSNQQIGINLLTSLIISLFKKLLFFLNCLSFWPILYNCFLPQKEEKSKGDKIGAGGAGNLFNLLRLLMSVKEGR